MLLHRDRLEDVRKGERVVFSVISFFDPFLMQLVKEAWRKMGEEERRHVGICERVPWVLKREAKRDDRCHL